MAFFMALLWEKKLLDSYNHQSSDPYQSAIPAISPHFVFGLLPDFIFSSRTRLAACCQVDSFKSASCGVIGDETGQGHLPEKCSCFHMFIF